MIVAIATSCSNCCACVLIPAVIEDDDKASGSHVITLLQK